MMPWQPPYSCLDKAISVVPGVAYWSSFFKAELPRILGKDKVSKSTGHRRWCAYWL